MKLQPGMIYRTRNGAQALIYMVEGTRRGWIHGAVNMDELFKLYTLGDMLGWEVSVWKPDGKHYKSRNFDLDFSIQPEPCREFLNQLSETLIAVAMKFPAPPQVLAGEYGSETDPSSGKEPF